MDAYSQLFNIYTLARTFDIPNISTTFTVVLFSGKYTTKECSGYLKYGSLGMQILRLTKEGEKTKECIQDILDKRHIVQIEIH